MELAGYGHGAGEGVTLVVVVTGYDEPGVLETDVVAVVESFD